MILDSCALIAIIMAEPDRDRLLAKIGSADAAGIGAPTLVEASMVLWRRLGGDPMPLMLELLESLEVEVIPFSADHVRAALAAFRRFGKGRHRAALNFGDCMAYATSAVSGLPLLYVGEDFARTDLRG